MGLEAKKTVLMSLEGILPDGNIPESFMGVDIKKRMPASITTTAQYLQWIDQALEEGIFDAETKILMYQDLQ